jgi:hypothetical protein
VLFSSEVKFFLYLTNYLLRFDDVWGNGCVDLRNVLRLLVTANVVPSSPILVTLMMESIHSSETSVLTRTTWRHIPEDGILQSKFCSLFDVLCPRNASPRPPRVWLCRKNPTDHRISIIKNAQKHIQNQFSHRVKPSIHTIWNFCTTIVQEVFKKDGGFAFQRRNNSSRSLCRIPAHKNTPDLEQQNHQDSLRFAVNIEARPLCHQP